MAFINVPNTELNNDEPIPVLDDVLLLFEIAVLLGVVVVVLLVSRLVGVPQLIKLKVAAIKLSFKMFFFIVLRLFVIVVC